MNFETPSLKNWVVRSEKNIYMCINVSCVLVDSFWKIFWKCDVHYLWRYCVYLRRRNAARMSTGCNKTVVWFTMDPVCYSSELHWAARFFKNHFMVLLGMKCHIFIWIVWNSVTLLLTKSYINENSWVAAKLLAECCRCIVKITITFQILLKQNVPILFTSDCLMLSIFIRAALKEGSCYVIWNKMFLHK